ncbi:spermatogenesis-associated protein 45 [Tachysurus ichikawai]
MICLSVARDDGCPKYPDTVVKATGNTPGILSLQDLHVDFKMNREQLHELNMRRETWCCVEADNRIWNRPERKHFARHLRNTCDFSDMLKVKPEVRSTWMTRSTNYREKRHFDESCKMKHQIIAIVNYL